MVEALSELIGAEILELADGGSITLHIRAWQMGRLTIHPGYGIQPKVIRTLRLWVPRMEKPIGPDYWDVTSQTLIYQLLPFLEREDFRARTFAITKHGVAPRARFSLIVT